MGSIIFSGAISAATTVPVCTNLAEQSHPVVYGDKVVWMDYRNDNGADNNPDIYMKDLKTGKESPVCTAIYEQTSPAIYGNKIVWTDGRNGKYQIGVINNYDIYMKDLTTGVESKITNNPCDQIQPSIYGNIVVYADNRNNVAQGGDGFSWDIYMKNLDTGKESPVCTNPSEQYFPKIYGNRIVWEDYRNNGGSTAHCDIYTNYLSTSKETRIASGLRPEIYGSKIVYENNYDDNRGISMKDIVTNKVTTLTTNIQARPSSFYGDLVAWDTINDQYLKNIKTGTLSHVSTNGMNGNIFGNRLVWEDNKNGNLDIYTATFDIYSPKVTLSDPINNAFNVATNKVIKITFNEPVKAGNMFIELKNSAGTLIPITRSISGNVLSITPNSLLKAGTKYTIILHTNSIKDLASNGLAALYTTKFTTTLPPVVTSTSPMNNAVNVAVNKVIQITFNKAIKLGTNPWIELKNQSGSAKPFTTTINGNTLYITANSIFARGTTYTVILHSNSVTSTGGAGLAAGYTTKFTTTTA